MRNSSVELFRIVATLLVLIVHFNGWFVGGMPENFTEFSTYRIGQNLIDALSCTCVNCFLVITGWYGLRFKWTHVWTIWSILVFICIPCYLLNAYLGAEFSISGLIARFIAIIGESYYVQCYLMLLVLSPILNSFITKYGRRILPYSLALWGIEFILDWCFNNKCLGFGKGYELTHFVLMYLLGQTAYQYKAEIRNIFTTSRCMLIYIAGIFIISAMYLIFTAERTFAYSNPVNIIMSFSLFFAFERHEFHSRFINWIGSSTLAVYILHTTPPVISKLQEIDVYLLNTYDYPIYLLMSLVIIIGVFVASILYDKIRTLFMPALGKKVCSYISKATAKYAL